MKDYLKSVSNDIPSRKDFGDPLGSLLNSPTSFLCSLSAGQDSISLFFLFFHFLNTVQMSSEKERSLTAFYCHHFWQPKNVFLISFLFQLTVLFHCQYIVSFSKKSLPNENRSRRLRKKSLSRVSVLQNTTNLLTGHTETDRVETLFTNLIRGTTVKNFASQPHFHLKKEEMFLFSSFNENFINIQFLTSKCSILQTFHQKSMRFQKVKASRSTFFVLFSKKRRFFDTPILAHVSRCYTFSHFRGAFPDQIGDVTKKVQPSLERAPNSVKPEKGDKHQRNQFFYLQKNYEQIQFSNTKPKFFCFFLNKSLKPVCFPVFEVTSPCWKKNDFLFHKPSSSSFSFYSFSSLKLVWYKPLNTTKRLFVRNCLDFYHFPVLTDLTNFSYKFSRNKMRHQFLPFFKQVFHDKAEKLVVQCFQIYGKEHEVTANTVRELLFIFLLDESLFCFNLVEFEQRKSAQWFLENLPDSLQLDFLQTLLFQYKNSEGTFFQISALKKRLF